LLASFLFPRVFLLLLLLLVASLFSSLLSLDLFACSPRSFSLSLSLHEKNSLKKRQPLFDKALIARGYSPNDAWRYSFYLPGAMHIFAGLLVFFFGQDMPDGSKLAVRRADAAAGLGSTAARTDVGWPSWRAAVLNYRTWVLTLVYAVTFGVEISVDNVLSRYFQTQFKL
jgi:nitrate/nitrite transporter NarK